MTTLEHGALVNSGSGNDSASRPHHFFDTTYQRYQQAVAASHQIVHDYCIAGQRIRLHFAGAALSHRPQPIAHTLDVRLSTDLSLPDLNVYLWDSASTGVAMPPPPWRAEDYLTRREVLGFSENGILASYDVTAGTLTLVDRSNGRAIFWCRNADQLPDYERGAPLRTILQQWFRQHGQPNQNICTQEKQTQIKGQFVHAAAVGLAHGGLLLAGKGGSGKSTTALACLNSPLQYVSDDYCLLTTDADFAEPDTGQFHAHSLYATGKLSRDSLDRLPTLAGQLHRYKMPVSGKAILFLHENFAHKLCASFPVQAIVVLNIQTIPQSRLVPASSMVALRALAPSTIFQLSGAGKETLSTLAMLAKSLPCYTLHLGADVETIPDKLMALLQEQRPEDRP